MDDDYKYFLDRINEIVKASGISQKELADRLGKLAPSISRMLSGDKKTHIGMFKRIAEECGYDIRIVPKVGERHCGKCTLFNDGGCDLARVYGKVRPDYCKSL